MASEFGIVEAATIVAYGSFVRDLYAEFANRDNHDRFGNRIVNKLHGFTHGEPVRLRPPPPTINSLTVNELNSRILILSTIPLRSGSAHAVRLRSVNLTKRPYIFPELLNKPPSFGRCKSVAGCFRPIGL